VRSPPGGSFGARKDGKEYGLIREEIPHGKKPNWKLGRKAYHETNMYSQKREGRCPQETRHKGEGKIIAIDSSILNVKRNPSSLKKRRCRFSSEKEARFPFLH